MKAVFLALLAGLAPLAVSATATLEQRLEKVERQMSRLTVLMMEMQDLRADLQENYGAVEEMVHQLEQLKKQQSSQYLDLEQRINRLGRKPAAAERPVAEKKMGQESEAYNRAFGLVRANQSKKALEAFNQFVKQFPKGEYSGDAWYWIGRLHSVAGEKKEASRAYAQARTILGDVIKRLPGTPQAERAAIKLKKITK